MLFLVDCDSTGVTEIVQLLDSILNLVKIIIPVVLVLLGSIDLGKAVLASKDDEIKKAQGLLLKRAGAAVAIFLLGSIVQLLFSIVPGYEDYQTCLEKITQNVIVETVIS